MDIGKIVFEEFNQWVYNDENQAGDKLQVIDASDLPEIIQNVVKKYNDTHNVSKSVCECKDEWLVDVRLNVMKCKKCEQEF